MTRRLLVLSLMLITAGSGLGAPASTALRWRATWATVGQGSVGPDSMDSGSLVTTYYGMDALWRTGTAADMRLEIEGGQSTGAEGGADLGERLGSQWDLNELQQDEPFFVAVLHATGIAADGRIGWQLGKISPKNTFDDNRAARAKRTKFIAEPLVRNSAVAFAGKGLGGALRWTVSPTVQLAACLSDANARSPESGFGTWRGEWFRAAEMTLRPRPGAALRLLAWGTERGGVHDGGWGLSTDWEVAPDWVVFGRAGGGAEWFAHSRRQISGGLAWEKPFGRADDFLALGFARGEDMAVTDRTEWLVELVYRRQMNRWLAVSPDLQHVRVPGSHAWVFGLRCVLSLTK